MTNFLKYFNLQTVDIKKTLTLTAKVTGKPEPEVKWFRDDKELAPSFKVKMVKAKEVVTLTISGVTEKMSGVYKVVATNKVGTAEHSAPVTVRGMYV